MRVICYTSSTLRKRKNKKAKKRKACRTFSSLERGDRRTSVESRILYIGIRESMKMFWVFLSDRKPHRRPVWPSDLSDSLATCLVDSWFHFVWIWEACWCVPSEVCFFSDFLPLNFNLSFNGKAPTYSRPGCTDLRASSSHRSWAEGSSLYVCTGGSRRMLHMTLIYKNFPYPPQISPAQYATLFSSVWLSSLYKGCHSLVFFTITVE